MTKKIIALCVLLTMNGFIRTDHHGQSHHDNHHKNDNNKHSDKIADDSNQRRLNLLNEQDEKAKFYLGLFGAGMFFGGTIFTATFISQGPKENARDGLVMLTVSALGARVIVNQIEEREEKRKDILKKTCKK